VIGNISGGCLGVKAAQPFPSRSKNVAAMPPLVLQANVAFFQYKSRLLLSKNRLKLAENNVRIGKSKFFVAFPT
jgi:hypothetical protein